MNITLYTTGPSCTRCRLSAALLKDSGVPFTTIDIRTNPDAQRYVTEELGYAEAPVIVVTQTPTGQLPQLGNQSELTQSDPTAQGLGSWHWSGFRPDRLRALIGAELARIGTGPTKVGTW